MLKRVFIFIFLTFIFQCSSANSGSVNVGVEATILVPKEITVIENKTTNYSISLSQAPSAELTIRMYSETSLDFGLLPKIKPSSLTFNSENFNKPQSVEVSYSGDDFKNNNFEYMIKHRITTTDPIFSEIKNSKLPIITAYLVYNDELADADHDGLIEISTAEMLNNIRYNLAGTSYKTSPTANGNLSGCPNRVCEGYELIANINLLDLLDEEDNGGNGNGSIDTTTVFFDKNQDGDTDDIDEEIIVLDTSLDTSWQPIGNASDYFTGNFDGGGYTISNLWVNIVAVSGDIYAGLFGYTNGNVQIKNVGILSGSIYASSSSYSYSGGLVGRARPALTITNSYFSGEIFSFSSSSSTSGGLVGRVDGDLTITSSYLTPDSEIFSFSSSSSTYSGGLVGRIDNALVIKNSYFAGEIFCHPSTHYLSGGFVGAATASTSVTITNSYWNLNASKVIESRRQVVGPSGSNSETTGAVGLTVAEFKKISDIYPADLILPIPGAGDAWNLGDSTELPIIKLCIDDDNDWKTCESYGDFLLGQNNETSVDTSTIDSDGDGLIEIHTEVMLNNIRYNLEGTSYKTSKNDTGNLTGCPADGCHGYELMADINLLSLLDINNNGRIDTIAVPMDTNLDLGASSNAGEDEQIIVIDTKPGADRGWVPIGDNSTKDDKSRFTGTFDGNGHTIANLWIRIYPWSDNIHAGLFGVTGLDVEIKNVGIISGSIYSSSTSSTGSLVGHATDSLTITNSYFSGVGGVFSFRSDTGGLLGSYSSIFSIPADSVTITIEQSYFSGNRGVFSSHNAGGLIGSSSDTSTVVIEGSYFNGDAKVSGYQYSGGLVGYIVGAGIIKNSEFRGEGGLPSLSLHTGGLVGHITGTSLTIKNSHFSGSVGVFAKTYSGGLLGSSSSDSVVIEDSSFIGESSVGSNSHSGGLVGKADSSLTITDSYFTASGTVFSSSDSSSTYSGGLVAQAGDTLLITDSYFSGSGGISSSSSSSSSSSFSAYSGGLVGKSDSSSYLTNNYFSGLGGVSSSSSTSISKSGGLVGDSGHSLTITNSYFSGSGGVSSSSSTSKSGGLVGDSGHSLTITNSYFSGSGGVSSSSSTSISKSGGLVGDASDSLTITNSYFSGSGGVSSSAFSGGLVGDVSSFSLTITNLTITNSYWNTTAPQNVGDAERISVTTKRAQGNVQTIIPSGTTGLTLVQLQAITGTHPSGLPNGATDNTKAWNLGTDTQLPAIKRCVPTITGTGATATTDWTMCASYGNLLPLQRNE